MYTGAGENESKRLGASQPTYPKALKTIMKNLSLRSGNRSFAFRMLSISVVAGLLSGLWISSASAAESQPGRCYKETDFNSGLSAWRCECTMKEYAAGVCKPGKVPTQNKTAKAGK